MGFIKKLFGLEKLKNSPNASQREEKIEKMEQDIHLLNKRSFTTAKAMTVRDYRYKLGIEYRIRVFSLLEDAPWANFKTGDKVCCHLDGIFWVEILPDTQNAIPLTRAGREILHDINKLTGSQLAPDVEWLDCPDIAHEPKAIVFRHYHDRIALLRIKKDTDNGALSKGDLLCCVKGDDKWSIIKTKVKAKRLGLNDDEIMEISNLIGKQWNEN